MKPPGFNDMSIDQLLERFTALALQQDDALLGSDIANVNKLGAVLHSIAMELKSRAGDQRRVLLRLYDHSKSASSSGGGHGDIGCRA